MEGGFWGVIGKGIVGGNPNWLVAPEGKVIAFPNESTPNPFRVNLAIILVSPLAVTRLFNPLIFPRILLP